MFRLFFFFFSYSLKSKPSDSKNVNNGMCVTCGCGDASHVGRVTPHLVLCVCVKIYTNLKCRMSLKSNNDDESKLSFTRQVEGISSFRASSRDALSVRSLLLFCNGKKLAQE